ncbi:MAG: LysR family transcriptional regulator [Clostridiaceae bacterium]|nr:LysR family transcriptional regulator [Clostridiaceae bacterium]
MDINFELYKVFYYVSKSLSFSEASEELFITQSAVSQSIKLLEEKLKCQLFFRNTKKVKLTREGEVLFGHIEQAFNFIKSGERILEEMNSLNQGEIRIGASDTICKYYLMPYIKSFNHAYPNIKIHVTNRTSPRCIELLRKGSVDLSVINIPEKFNYSNIKVKNTQRVRDVFIANENFKGLKDRKVSLKELESYPLIVLERNSTTREFFDNLMAKHEVSIKPEIELGSVDILMEMTKIGLGIAFAPEECVKPELSKGDIFIIDIKEEIPDRNLGFVIHSNIPLPLAASKFVELLEGKL